MLELPRDTGNGFANVTTDVPEPVRTTEVAGCGRGL